MQPGHRCRAALVAALALSFVFALPSPVEARGRLAPYRGMGAWLDIYDDQAWDHPVRTMSRFRRRGIRTIYLETCHFNCREALHRPVRMGHLVRAAHAHGMRAVAWYLPGLGRPRRDLRRAMAAIRFATGDGHRFDSFALDVEANHVHPVWRRNRRLVALSRAIRERVGRRYGLGAITPPWFFDWPNFPYRALAHSYDVFLPMNYFTVRDHGAAVARVHTRRNIRLIRRETGDPGARIHDIGGLAEDLDPREVRAIVRTDLRHGVVGTSLYDSFTTDNRGWQELRRGLGRGPAGPVG